MVFLVDDAIAICLEKFEMAPIRTAEYLNSKVTSDRNPYKTIDHNQIQSH